MTPPGTSDAHSPPISITLLPSPFSLLLVPSVSLSVTISSSFPYTTYISSLFFFLSLQATETDFSNVGSMIECGLFAEALDSIRSAVLPGLLPPVAYVISLLEYALQVGI